MVTFHRDGSRLVARLTNRFGRQFDATWETSGEWIAEYLVSDMQHRLGTETERLRAEAYARGWADAKAKRMKRTSFIRGR